MCQSVAVVAIGMLFAGVVRAEKLPSNDEINAAIRAMQPTIEKALSVRSHDPVRVDVAPAKGITVPEVLAKPPGKLPPTPPMQSKAPVPRFAGDLPPHLRVKQPTVIDFNRLVKKYEAASKPVAFGKPTLYLFASFSIPEEKLKKMVTFASEYGATVVFRGGVDEEDLSLKKLLLKILKLRVHPMANVQIHSAKFKRYKVEAAPTWVLVMSDSVQDDVNGCAPDESYASVTGDVPAEFALTYIARRGHPPIAKAAEGLLLANRRVR